MEGRLLRRAANILNMQPQINDKGWSSNFGLQPLTVENQLVTKCSTEPRTWTDYLDERLNGQNMDMSIGTLNVRGLYRADSLMTVSRELARYKLDLVAVQEVRWESRFTELAEKYEFVCEKGE
jgi:hypothetical protein